MEKPKSVERKTVSFPSLLLNKDGGHSQISVKLENGLPKGAFFFDIDKTLVHIEDVYKLIRPKLWPNVVDIPGNTELTQDKIHLAGFQLGTMWHEMIRMKRLNEGDHRFLDMKFTEAYFADGGEGHGIESSEHPLHKEADDELQRFDAVATEECDKVYKETPEVFEESKIKPVFHLLDLYKRLGIPMVGMSANPRKFIHAVCAYAGLSDYFLACGNDTDTQGMKEFKMVDLIDQLGTLGVPIPYDKIYIFGDSPNGDVGSGPRFQKLVGDKHPETNVRGILICDDDNAYGKGQAKITDPLFKESVLALQLDQVPESVDGAPRMAGRNRKKFLKQL